MKPTRHACVTEIGKERKLHRLIARELEKRYPDIYREIANEANEYIAFDQCSPTSTVVAVAHGKQSIEHRILKAAKRMQLDELNNTPNFEVFRFCPVTKQRTK